MNMTDEERTSLTSTEYRYFIDPVFQDELKRLINAKNLKLYRYLLTFTLREDVDDVKQAQVQKYIVSQSTRLPLKIQYFAYSLERTAKGRPHWHCVVATTKPLKKDRFNYYVKLYGNIDISKTKGTNSLEALEYISKDTSPTVVIDYL